MRGEAELTKLVNLAEQIVDKAERRWSQWSGTWYAIDGDLFEDFDEALHAFAVAEGRGRA